MRARIAVMSALVLALFLLLSRTSPEKAAFERLAWDLNPLLVEMKPVVARVTATDASDLDETLGACWSDLGLLRRVREVRFEYDDVELGLLGIDPGRKGIVLSARAKHLLDVHEACKPSQRDICAEWCRAEWLGIMDEVTRLRLAAKRHGVIIVSLRP